MSGEITPNATFGEDCAAEAEEDCWLLLGDVTKTIVDRCAAPRADAPGRGNVLAFPGRGTSDPEYISQRVSEIERFEDCIRRGKKWTRDNRPPRK